MAASCSENKTTYLVVIFAFESNMMQYGWANARVRSTHTIQNILTPVFLPTQYLLQTSIDFCFWLFYIVTCNLLTLICSSNIRHKTSLM